MKEKARKLEAKGQLDKAIRQYAKILEELDGKPELADELALFNKLGDLYVKLGNITSAVEEYEKAINHYAEQGFPNNAIALCNKVLRNAPGRTHIYLKLAKLMMQRGFASEAKQNLLEYAERMQKAGKLEDAFLALKEFADLSPDSEEIRLVLAEQLKKAARTDEAQEQLAKLYNELQDSGDDSRARATLEKMRAIDPEYDLDAADVQPASRKREKTSDIVFLDLDDVVAPLAADDADDEPAEPVEPLGLEPTSIAADVDSVESAGVDFALPVDTSSDAVPADEGLDAVAPIEGLDVGESFDDVDDMEEAPVPALDIESTSFDDALDVPEIEPVDDLPDLEVPVSADDVEFVGLDGVEGLVVDGPEADLAADLPMLEVPGPDDDIEVIGLDEVEDLAVDETDAEPAADLPMLDVTPSEEMVEDIEIDMPWDVGEDEQAVDVPVADIPTSVDEPTDVLEPVVDSLGAEDDVDVGVEVPAFDVSGVEDLGMGDGGSAGEILLEAPEGLEDAATDISALEFAVADDPDAPNPHRELGEALIETGDRERGIQELDFAIEAHIAAGDTRYAQDVLEEILRVDPNSVHHHQKRVEFALQQEEDAPLIEAYLELADALIRNEALEQARFVYESVLEKDPTNERARFALDTLLPDAVEEEPEPVVADEPDDMELAEPAGFVVEAEVSEVGEVSEPEVDLPEVIESEAAEVEAIEADVAEAEDIEAEDFEVDDIEVEVSEAEVVEAGPPVELEVAAPIAAEPDPEPEGGGFVDLGALIMDEEEVAKDTRMRIDHAEPRDQEQQDFAEMLSEFKKGIDANIDADDAQAHYDLGVAFKEMGLLDEAISEFQKALRGSEDRLRTSESLGLCFFEKGQYAVAATVLRRAIESESGGDDDKIGLLYWLGMCEQEQGRKAEALGYYQRIFSIDINFQDVSDRVNDLTDAGG